MRTSLVVMVALLVLSLPLVSRAENGTRVSAKKIVMPASATEAGKGADLSARAQPTKYVVPKAAIDLNAEAYSLQYSGHVPEAKALFLRLSKKYPKFEWPFSNLGIIYMQERNFEKAKFYLKRAIAINPEYINALHNLAMAHYKSGEIDQAELCVRKILTINPDETDAHNLLGTILRAKPKPQKQVQPPGVKL